MSCDARRARRLAHLPPARSMASRRMAPSAAAPTRTRGGDRGQPLSPRERQRGGERGRHRRDERRAAPPRARRPSAAAASATWYGRSRSSRASASRRELLTAPSHSCTASLRLAKRFSPMPSTSRSSASERKPPFSVRYSRMRSRQRGADPVELVELLDGGRGQAELRHARAARLAAAGARRRHARRAPHRAAARSPAGRPPASPPGSRPRRRRVGARPPARATASAARASAPTRTRPGRATAPATCT